MVRLALPFAVALLALFVGCEQPTSSDDHRSPVPAPTSEPTEVRRCFLSVTTSGDGSIVDSMVIKLTIVADHVSGSMDQLPGAKDRMRGTLDGTFRGDTVLAMYTYAAEGVTSTEQRVIVVNGGHAAILTGEMEMRDGQLVLKDRAHATPGMVVPEVSCE